MNLRAVSGMLSMLLLVGVLTSAFNIRVAHAILPVRNIDTGEGFMAIQNAIDDPDTANGHTILVDAGIYYENIVVGKSVSLLGEDRKKTIIDGAFEDTVIYVTADNVVIEGFTLQNCGWVAMGGGITLASGNNIITGNDLRDNEIGIFVWSDNNCIFGNNVADNGIGIILDCASYNTISGNNITRNMGGGGIDLYGSYPPWESSHNIISENNITYNSQIGVIAGGIGVSDNAFYHNNIVDNDIQALSGGEAFNIWDDGYPSGGNYWSDYEERYPDAEELDDSGIWGTPYVIDENNQDNYPLMNPWTPTPEARTWTVDDDGPADFHTIQEAIDAASPGDTIYVKAGTYYPQSPHWYTLRVDKAVSFIGEDKQNTIIDANHTGTVIYLLWANNVTINGFTIRNSHNAPADAGISITSSSGNNISNNIITNNPGNGIWLDSSFDNTIVGNTFSNNLWGISLAYNTSHNEIFHNNFINNSIAQIIIGYDVGTNTWDDNYPSGGNYWSDYADVDLYSGPYQNETGSDGIWDHPYVIDVNNKDRYPLINPWTPTPLRVNGIDVSHHQGDVDWSEVHGAGYRFAFAKASEGVGWVDSKFQTNMDEGRSAGLLMGAYHFARPDLGNDAADEARYFVSVAEDYLTEGYLRPALDLEVGSSLGNEALSNWVHEWMETVKDETGIEPIIYVNSNYANNYLDTSVAEYNLWIAHWTYDPTASPNTGIWDNWDFWQYSDNGSVTGISGDVDLDTFNGDMPRLYDTFVIAPTPNQPPDPPIYPLQFEPVDDPPGWVRSIPVGGTIFGDTVIFNGEVSDPDNDRVKLQIELRRLDEYDGSFIGDYTHKSEFVDSDYGVMITVTGLIPGSYHWQARTIDEAGATSNWISFPDDEPNPESAPDFTIELVFRPPYRFYEEWGHEPLAVGKAHAQNYHRAFPENGKGLIGSFVAAQGAGSAYANAVFGFSDLWESAWSGNFNIAAAFNITAGYIEMFRWMVAKTEVHYIYVSLRAELSVHDYTSDQEVFRTKKVIFDDKIQWKLGLPIPPIKTKSISEKYENNPYIIQGFVNLQEGHQYEWRFRMEIHAEVWTIGPVKGHALGDIFAELIDVRIGHPVLKPEPTSTTYVENVMYVAVGSPVEVLVVDPEGRQIGFDLASQQEVNEIPEAWYIGRGTDVHLIRIPTPIIGNYEISLIGTDQGTYELAAISIREEEATMFTATDIPTSPNATHQYTVDWDALFLGEEGVTVQVDSDDDGVFEHIFTADGELTHGEFMLQTATTVDFDPETLNLRSQGQWIACYIELPEGYNLSHVDISNVQINNTISVDSSAPTQIGDYDNDSAPDLMVRFDRASIVEWLSTMDYSEGTGKGSFEILTITGTVLDVRFEGSDTIKVLHK